MKPFNTTSLANSQQKQRLIAVTTGAFVFQAVFWKEKMALNTVGYFVFIMSTFFILYKSGAKLKNVYWLLAASIVTLAAVVIHNTILSKIAFTTSLLLLVLFGTNAYRSLHYALLAMASRIVFAVPQLFADCLVVLSTKRGPSTNSSHLRTLFFPIALALIFLGIYLIANDILADVAANLSLQVANWFGCIFEWLSFARFFFFIVGIAITAMLLINHTNKIKAKENTELDSLLRTHEADKESVIWSDIKLFVLGRSAKGMQALKQEYRAAVITLILLNTLLFALNVTDIIYVWFNRIYKPGFAWVQFVHHGADILVYSILLAIIVMLFFFRGNINFLKENRLLRQLSYVWLIQNLVLAISVCIRNYYYVAHMGLAYKRIGLFLFTGLVIIGLITVFIKIKSVRTAFYLLRVNGWTAFATLVLSSIIHWDVMIAQYNLSKKDEIPVDVGFLLTLSDKAIPVLDKYHDFLTIPQTDLQRQYYKNYDNARQTEILKWRKEGFLKEHINYSWLSWNYADNYVLNYLKSQPK